MARVRLEGLEKRFGAARIIPPLDLTIEDGEFFVFVGPSGCGKSTLLGLIAGLESPSAGSIRFDDRRIDPLAPGERDVAMVFQSYALYPHLTVRENIAFPLTVRRLPREEIAHEVQRAAQALELESLLEHKPKQLSGGQRQRVALGRALVRKPKVFLMDEPLSNLDARLRLEMREELKRLHQSHRITTVYVTHDQEEAMALADRIAVLNAGRIEQCASPQQVYDDPANLFVARFIGSPPINVLDGERLHRFPALAELYRETPARDIAIGVRPADILFHADPQPDSLPAELVLTELTGADLWVVGLWEGQKIKGRAAPGAHFKRGSPCFFCLPRKRVLAFARASGLRVGSR
jgi:multiple sugar transport system ATP-binding protein